MTSLPAADRGGGSADSGEKIETDAGVRGHLGLLLKAVLQANNGSRLSHVGCLRAYGTAAGLSVPRQPLLPPESSEELSKRSGVALGVREQRQGLTCSFLPGATVPPKCPLPP